MGRGRGRLYTYRYTVTTSMIPALRWAVMSHFNVSLIVRDKVTRPCPQTTIFEEKGELKQYRTKVLTAYQPTALPLGQTGSHVRFGENIGVYTLSLGTHVLVFSFNMHCLFCSVLVFEFKS